MVNAMFLSPGLSHGMWGKASILATYLLDKILCKENKTVLMNYEIGKSSRIDDKVVQDQRQRDDNDLQDERQDQPKEEEVKPRRSKKGSGYQQKDRKPSQNDKTEHGMEKTVQNQGQSPKMPKIEYHHTVDRESGVAFVGWVLWEDAISKRLLSEPRLV
ncbi:hypothetical protein Tco_1037712 [Tanacetum coccineum]